AALQSVLDGKTDLAAIGRPLTAEEKARGFVVAPQKRHKIAIVVGPENSFTGDLTFKQFAQIFQGEITDWSEVGGSPGRIQLIVS
ncbi:MAG: substrate-binding domain-containing protein, partial [Phormidesmis sp. CAN_BIN36]|nr:substrate-binding domain-containing protein [Phormidesmis sp. CAN_BIN36]